MNVIRQRMLYICSDLLATIAGWLLLYVYRYDVTGFLSAPTLHDYLTMPQVQTNLWLCPAIWIGFFAMSGYYNRVFFRSHIDEIQSTFLTCLVGTLFFFFSMVIDDVPFIDDSRFEAIKIVHVSPRTYLEIIMVMFACVFVPVYGARYLITHRTNRHISHGKIALRTLMVGNGKMAQQLQRELAAHTHKDGYHIVAQVSAHPLDVTALSTAVAQHQIQAFLVAPDQRDQRIVDRLVFQLLPYGLPIRLKATPEEIQNGQAKVSSLTTMPMLEYSPEIIAPFQHNIKRLFDILGACFALLLLLPVFAVLGVMIHLDSPGPIFYSQLRLGRSARPFKMYKLRSMRTDAEQDGQPQLASPDDSRITRLGAVLRKYRLDELPQFWNVLRGDMSLVGPRPEREFYVRQIMDVAPYYSKLLQLRPGITSWGQVKYGYAQNIFQMVERMRYDLMYVDNCTLGIDLKILGYTIRTVITGQGI